MFIKKFKTIGTVCLLLATICLGPELAEEVHEDGIRMQKSGFVFYPDAGTGQVVDALQKEYQDPSETTGNLANEAPSSAHTASGTSVGQNGAQGNASANQGSASVNQSSADSANTKIGPSMVTQIVTQGELGVTQQAILGGAKLTLLQSQTDQQILSCIIQTSQGKMIVVDGGMVADANYLLNQLWAGGGHVGAWLVTHPHGDHAGALFGILENQERNLTIDGIYYSLAHSSWYTANDPEEATMAHAFINTLSQMPPEILHGEITQGYELMVDDVKIQVMNNRYDIANNAGNNASIVYKITVNGKSILFLGDMGEEGGKQLIADCGDGLKSDIVQMAHHGQGGAGQSVYQLINPTICLWPTPRWLWDNNNGSGINSGNWKTAETKGWMNRLNASILHYVTKDGNQTIQ